MKKPPDHWASIGCVSAIDWPILFKLFKRHKIGALKFPHTYDAWIEVYVSRNEVANAKTVMKMEFS